MFLFAESKRFGHDNYRDRVFVKRQAFKYLSTAIFNVYSSFLDVTFGYVSVTDGRATSEGG